MAKPTDLFRWATGISAITAPSEAKKTQGWIFAERPPPKVFNWLFNGAYLWHTYVNNLHNEPEFLNKDYTWLGDHRFSGGRFIVNGVTEFNGTYTQFNNVSPMLNGPANEIVYGTNGSAQPRAKSLLLPLEPQVSLMNNLGAGFGWTGEDGYVYTDDGDCPYTVTIPLPTGCVLTGFVVFGHTQGGPGPSGTAVRASLYKSTPQGFAGVPPVVTQLLPAVAAAVSGAGFGSPFLMGNNSSGLQEVINRNASQYYVKVWSSGAPIRDTIYSIHVTYNDPGPRNG